jgi:hypothetical protein
MAIMTTKIRIASPDHRERNLVVAAGEPVPVRSFGDAVASGKTVWTLMILESDHLGEIL